MDEIINYLQEFTEERFEETRIINSIGQKEYDNHEMLTENKNDDKNEFESEMSMKKNTLMLTLFAGVLLFSSCASKKELQNCQFENKELTGTVMTTKEQLAAAQATRAPSSFAIPASRSQRWPWSFSQAEK